MKKSKNPVILALSILVLLLNSCANMVAPSGGSKDEKPPVVKIAQPENNSKNFNQKKIELTFDEYIVLKDIQNQLIVSPGNVETEVNKKGKKIIIEIKSDLEKETTYIINFGDAISDYTENNIYKEFKYIFSTGNEIDSLTIEGKVIDAFKTEEIKDALVCLYTDFNDSIVYKQKPNYTVKTDITGNFKFTNLKSGDYKLFVIKEVNNNKIFDSNDEMIGFSDTIIKLRNNIKLYPIKIFNEIPNQLKVLSKNTFYQKAEVILNKRSDNLKITFDDKKIDTIVRNISNDSLNIYYKQKTDSSAIYISNSGKIDTLIFKFSKSLKKDKFNIDVTDKILNDSITIKSFEKFNVSRPDSIVLIEDSIPVKFTIKNITHNIFQISYTFNREKKYELKIGDSSFVNYQDNYNSFINKKITFYSEEDFGNINIKINSTLNNKLIELVNDKGDIIKRTKIKNQTTINYTKIFPGTYRIRIINDDNNNNRWDTGNYINKIQPEELKYFINPIKVRANWDVDLEIKE